MVATMVVMKVMLDSVMVGQMDLMKVDLLALIKVF